MVNPFSKPIRGRLLIFISSVIVSVLLLGIYQITIYSVNVEVKQNEATRMQHNIDISWKIVESVINDSIIKSQQTLKEQISVSIVNDINKTYGNDKTKLQKDFENLSNLTYDSPVIHILANNIRGKYFDNIHTDGNDMFILMKKFGIISDLSISTSSGVPRTIENEISRHYNKELATQAFDTLTQQDYQQRYIFWQWYKPDIKYDTKKITSMDITELERIFKDSKGDTESLKTYEFLVPEYIFMDKDILGNPLVNDRGIRQSIYQFIVVQRFNVYEVIQNDTFKKYMFEIMADNNQSKKIVLLSFIQQILSVITLIFILFVLISATKIKERFFDHKIN
jgi:hypothetical protein